MSYNVFVSRLIISAVMYFATISDSILETIFHPRNMLYSACAVFAVE